MKTPTGKSLLVLVSSALLLGCSVAEPVATPSNYRNGAAGTQMCQSELNILPEQTGPKEAYKWQVIANCEGSQLLSCGTNVTGTRCKTLNRTCAFGGKTLSCVADNETPARIQAAQSGAGASSGIAAQNTQSLQTNQSSPAIAGQTLQGADNILSTSGQAQSSDCSSFSLGVEQTGMGKWRTVSACPFPNAAPCGQDPTDTVCSSVNKVCTYSGKTFGCISQ